jgi:phasin family protein
MVQQAKKMGTQSHQKYASNTAKISETVIRAIEPVQKTQEKIFKAGRDNVEKAMHSADTCNRVAGELAGICSENINACVESGSKAFPILQEVTTEIMESCNRSFSESAEIAREAFSCRTINDMVELQNRAVQQAFDNYFNTTNKLCSMLFDSCTEALEPLHERTSVASEQIRKALAA